MTIPVVGDGEYLGAGNTNERLNVGKSTQAVLVGPSASGAVGFYGTTPVVRRAYTAAVHATSAQATSASFGATQLATLQEIQSTLIGVGMWATA